MMGVDVCTAYLYGKLDEEIYMHQPEGFIARGQESKVIKLQRALYGLKQAGLAWWKELTQSMKTLGFSCLNSDTGIYVCQEGTEIIIVVVYVDDAMFLGVTILFPTHAEHAYFITIYFFSSCFKDMCFMMTFHTCCILAHVCTYIFHASTLLHT